LVVAGMITSANGLEEEEEDEDEEVSVIVVVNDDSLKGGKGAVLYL
jgi:hypothetical protein